MQVLAVLLCLIFTLLALWHVDMAAHPHVGESTVVPSLDGKPLFVPSRRGTLAVATLLLACAVIVGCTAGFLGADYQSAGRWLSYALALCLMARALGDFRYVGFFKRVRGTPFARADDRYYSPICLTLAVSVGALALSA